MREFASVLSAFQVGSCIDLPLGCGDASGRYRTKRTTGLICTRTSYAQWKTSRRSLIPLKRLRLTGQVAGCRMYSIPFPFTTIRLTDLQIDCLNLEGYENLKHWVAELDKRIEGILLQRLTHIIQVWCAKFNGVGDSDTRRDLLPVRDVRSKRRADT